MVRVLALALAATLLSAAGVMAQTQGAQGAQTQSAQTQSAQTQGAQTQGAQGESAHPALPAPPNCSDRAHHALDFWIGEWDAYRADNNRLSGRSSITASDDGCVINEHWTSVGAPRAYSGRSLNTFDAVSGKWEQYWADSTGAHVYFVGGAQAGGVVSMATLGPNDTSPGPNGQPQWQRVTFTPRADGTVLQQGDVSDDGRTWTLSYALIYRHHRE